jgi:hypothetical protein
MPTTHALATRCTDSNPNHHLWNNNGTWWCYFTLRSAAGGSKRHRISLKTHDLNAARSRRDGILLGLQTHSGRIAA